MAKQFSHSDTHLPAFVRHPSVYEKAKRENEIVQRDCSQRRENFSESSHCSILHPILNRKAAVFIERFDSYPLRMTVKVVSVTVQIGGFVLGKKTNL